MTNVVVNPQEIQGEPSNQIQTTVVISGRDKTLVRQAPKGNQTTITSGAVVEVMVTSALRIFNSAGKKIF